MRSAGYRTISDHMVKSIHLGNAKNLIEYFKKETWYGLGMLGTLRYDKFDKPLIATFLFFFFLLGSLFPFLFYLSSGKSLWGMVSLFSAAGIVLLPFLAALERIILKKRRGNLFYVTIIFMVFFLARINSLSYSFGMRKMKPK